MTDLLSDLHSDLAAPAWTEDFAGELTCVAIAEITHDVRSFTFELPGSTRLRFEPGQYLTLGFELGGVPVERCYTIASSPEEPQRPTITVKKIPGGPASTWLHEQLSVGVRVRARGPFGLFSSAFHPSDRYLFLSAGSGITPLMSMTRALRDQGRLGRGLGQADVVFVHCARTPQDIIFRAELTELADSGAAKVVVLCEEDSAHEAWTGARGRLTLPALLTAAPDLLAREVFTCGPPPFMSAVRDHLDLVAADPGRCHTESFVLGADAPPLQVDPGRAGTTYRVTFQRSGRIIECAGDTPVLTAAARAGLALPSSCEQGACGTCKTVLLAGRVDMVHAGGIRQREIDGGEVLLCCSRPLDDLEVDA